MSDAQIPSPTLVRNGLPVMWGSEIYNQQAHGDVYQLVRWGDSAPDPLRLSPVERCALEWYGGVCEFPDGTTVSIIGGVKSKLQKSNGEYPGGWIIGGNKLPPPIAWGTDRAALAVFPPDLAHGSYLPKPSVWGAEQYDPAKLATAAQIINWGATCPPGTRLTRIEVASLASGGWLNVTGAAGMFVISLSDARFYKQQDGQWVNVNHQDQPLGLGSGIGSKPEHGLSGLIDDIFHDITHDPLGSLLLVIVLVTAAPALPAVLGGLEAVATVGALAGATQAIATGGKNTSILDTEASAAKWTVTHPAEIGRVAAATELIVAGSLVGAKGLGKLGQGLLASGLSGALDGGVPQLPTSAPPNSVPAKQKHWWDAFRRKG